MVDLKRTNSHLADRRVIVDFRVTVRCDMECPFCCAMVENGEIRPEMTMAQIEDALIKLKDVGVTTITITGGEPLLRKETPEVISFAYRLGLEVYLSTDGTFLAQRYREVEDYISALGLPLDGSNLEMNLRMGRRPYHFDNILRILEQFKSTPPNHLLRIGSVVSKVNKHDIEAIGKLLFENRNLYPPDVWRLYQFEPLKRGAVNKNTYEVTNEEFQEIYDNVKLKFPNARISVRSNDPDTNAYFFVLPNGTFQIANPEYVAIADLLNIEISDLRQLFHKYRPIVEKSRANREWMDTPGAHDELLDIVDKYDNVIAQKSRSQVYREGRANFRVVNVFLENAQGQIWIPRRRINKALFPLCLDLSAGGHVRSGETYEKAFVRELQEELRIDTDCVPLEVMGYLTPSAHGVSAFMKVYKVHMEETPDYNPADFMEGSWITPSEVVRSIEKGEPAKDDLLRIIKIFYMNERE